jgi:hypothetical protein
MFLAYSNYAVQAHHFYYIKCYLLHGNIWRNNLVIVAPLVFADDSSDNLIVPDFIDQVASRTWDIALGIRTCLSRFSYSK